MDDDELWRAFEWWSDMGRVIVFGGGNDKSSSRDIGIYAKQVTFNPNVMTALITSLLQSSPLSASFCATNPPFINTQTYPLLPASPASSPRPFHHPNRVASTPTSPWFQMTLKYDHPTTLD
jgi:hypothetical protein